MLIESVQIVAVPVSDQDRARAFYEERLGLGVIADEEAGPGRRWLQVGFPGGGATLALVAGESVVPGSATGLVFECTDLDRCVELLRERGVTFPDGIREMPWARTALFSDPDGNELVLQTPLEPPY